MISVEQAQERILALFDVMESEMVPLEEADGRVLVKPVKAKRDQPPFASSAMDGYAIQQSDLIVGKSLLVIGESAAGSRFEGEVSSGQAVRIFTGGVVPKGADHILIQEDADRQNDKITILPDHDTSHYIRSQGADFKDGDEFSAPKRLNHLDIALLAAMNVPVVEVARKPIIALIATGDELVRPGETPNQDQIISSNNYALAALIKSAGGIPRILPIARDNPESLQFVYGLAKSADAIVTLGGASVGDHDLVASEGAKAGLDLDFYKIAMRPGKPLMAGKFGDIPMLGLPGNPVSSIVCAEVFLRPALQKMLGHTKPKMEIKKAILAHPIAANGPRCHFMRSQMLQDNHVRAFEKQDSSLLSVLSKADCLIKRPPNAPSIEAGEQVEILPLIKE